MAGQGEWVTLCHQTQNSRNDGTANKLLWCDQAAGVMGDQSSTVEYSTGYGTVLGLIRYQGQGCDVH